MTRVLFAVAIISVTMCLTAMPASAQWRYAYVGEVETFAFNYCPLGWAPLDGRLLPIDPHNTGLFSLIGTSYGGDGQHSFALPNNPAKPLSASGSGAGINASLSMGYSRHSRASSRSSAAFPVYRLSLFL
jgi:microcystin-dependent protein